MSLELIPKGQVGGVHLTRWGERASQRSTIPESWGRTRLQEWKRSSVGLEHGVALGGGSTVRCSWTPGSVGVHRELSFDPKGRKKFLGSFKLRGTVPIINTSACCVLLFMKVLEQVRFQHAILQRHCQVNSYLRYDALHTSMPFHTLFPCFVFCSFLPRKPLFTLQNSVCPWPHL